MRRDLTIPQRAVQASHAVIESVRSWYSNPSIEHPHLVMCGVKSEQQLLNASERLTEKGIPHSLWREPDRHNEATALATAPLVGESRKVFKKYQLIK